MKNSLLFDFTVNKESCTVFVNREFNAAQSIVWDAFTKQEILDRWWAPHPWKSRTKIMNFEEGGYRLYAMVGPEGQEHWSTQSYTSITPITNYKMVSAFSDDEANINTEMPASHWDLSFDEKEGVTTVRIVIKHDTLSNLEMLIQMGFKEGFTMTLNALNELLNDIKR